MPGWSPEIANEFILLAESRGRRLDQMQLNDLVYIAHGWHLAGEDQPLTGDRPEAWQFGPVYRRVADALIYTGTAPVTRPIRVDEVYPGESSANHSIARANLTALEIDSIRMVFDDYGDLPAGKLSLLTAGESAPWSKIFAEGSGEFKEISHLEIRDQFLCYIDEFRTEADVSPR